MTLSEFAEIRKSVAEIERLSLEAGRKMSCHDMPALRMELRRLWKTVQESMNNELSPHDEA